MIRMLWAQVVSASVLLATPVAQAGTCDAADERLDDRIMVRLVSGAALSDFVSAFERDHPGVTVTPIDSIADRDIHLLSLELPDAFGHADEKLRSLEALEAHLEQRYLALLAWAEFLYTNRAPEGSTGSTLVDHPASASLFGGQYAVTLTGAGAAHARSTGAGVVVAILDTGVDASHPQLAGRVLSIGHDFVDNDPDPSDVGDGLDTDGDGLIDEMTGHGTFAAGLVSLIAPDAWLLPVRVLDSDGNGDMWALARGMFYAIDRGVEVINVSISSTYNSDAVEDAAEEAKSLGIVVVAAAGNCNREEPREFPAAGSSVLGVAATDDTDVKGDFSNYSDRLFISAPGVSFFNADQPDPDRSIISLVPGEGYAYWEGTSMAAPLVAGAVALVRAQHPEWPAGELIHDLIEARLESTAEDIDMLNPPYAGLLGAGRINIEAAVNLGPVAPPFGDLNGDGAVNVLDLIEVLLAFGQTHSSADLNGDGTVNVLDLIALLLELA